MRRALWIGMILCAAPADAAKPPKVPLKATLSCRQGIHHFPFLKPWIGKLDNFIAPIETGTTEGSLYHAVGVTTGQPDALERWRKDKVVLPLDWRHLGGDILRNYGRLETAWLGPVASGGPTVSPGPGFSKVAREGGHADRSQMGGRRTVVVEPYEALKDYSIEALRRAGPIGSWKRFWAFLFSVPEQELLGKCARAEGEKGGIATYDCPIKFDDNEVRAVTGASHQYRLDQFRRIIEQRIRDYKEKGHVRAYEGTHRHLQWEDLPIARPFPAKYHTHFWLPPDRELYGYDVLDAEPGHHKPIVALFNRHCDERGEAGERYVACTDVVLYNNHSFDFWGRVVYFFPWCGATVVMAYEAIDIDPLKESRFIRTTLFGEVRKFVGLMLETRLRRLHMLGRSQE